MDKFVTQLLFLFMILYALYGYNLITWADKILFNKQEEFVLTEEINNKESDLDYKKEFIIKKYSYDDVKYITNKYSDYWWKCSKIWLFIEDKYWDWFYYSKCKKDDLE